MRLCFSLGILLALAGCASERVVLLPSKDGRPSEVVVRWQGVEHRLDQPYASATRRPFVLSRTATSSGEVGELYGTTLSALPERPVSFVVYFLEGTDTLTPESMASFDRIKAQLVSRSAPEVQVIGHADRVGSVADNDILARTRADSVSKILVEAGIPADLIAVSSRGEREPAIATPDGVAEPLNRRVEISVR
ncbi:MAG: OmpA family protein [Betaproteobacteria bacterium]|jgi:outer membrane protein OmpA-like peptidoglycan-associated protein|nr:OmpA family protein [Betaproteobacteria bacterium]HMV19915.1 OmpA family protein [Rhodocyclaceae bacterium]HMW78343.1 OmpA family protein [Rhodocyclaceae bacterium]HNE43266.1 OmpA family protein [Rhodocyclaceae bacterium]HNM21723.1 OmpA family protein [Rhodocyclaceae bacterium]